METATRQPLQEYLNLTYPFHVDADVDGGYVIVFPDLPGCMTQVDSLDQVGLMAEEIRTLWIETAYAQGLEIPLPAQPHEFSGKFNVRIPRSLHRILVESAEQDGVSLNQYIVGLLARHDAQARMQHRIQELETRLAAIQQPTS
ncbi:MAG: toxin-antitoxin system HicB family antitoxin [Herpetosiphonaceae bacterium]|nr:toxin-antitoxin system HicB family antitoxin [Herpetosiphonaceae bacterium]